MRAKRMVAVLMTVLFAGGAAGTMPASAGPPTQFQDLFTKYSLTVNGTYVPLIGDDLDCEGPGSFGILWYAPGSAPDFLWNDLSESGDDLAYTSLPLSVNGTYQPFVGDFDGDDCDDIFWYAPGPGADFVWFANSDGSFTSKPVTVNGHYTPAVSNFNGTANDDIFWYADSGGTESIWQGTDTRSFTSATAPQVSASGYQVVPFQSGGLFFYRPGTGSDHLWSSVAAGASAPGSSYALDPINGTYEAHSVGSAILLYGPGAAADRLIGGFAPDGSFLQVPGSIAGTYRVAALPVSGTSALLFHAPGATPDSLWVFGA